MMPLNAPQTLSTAASCTCLHLSDTEAPDRPVSSGSRDVLEGLLLSHLFSSGGSVANESLAWIATTTFRADTP